jgi:hypothetical protein
VVVLAAVLIALRLQRKSNGNGDEFDAIRRDITREDGLVTGRTGGGGGASRPPRDLSSLDGPSLAAELATTRSQFDALIGEDGATPGAPPTPLAAAARALADARAREKSAPNSKIEPESRDEQGVLSA